MERIRSYEMRRMGTQGYNHKADLCDHCRYYHNCPGGSVLKELRHSDYLTEPVERMSHIVGYCESYVNKNPSRHP